jgi:hypothetical protein
MLSATSAPPTSHPRTASLDPDSHATAPTPSPSPADSPAAPNPPAARSANRSAPPSPRPSHSAVPTSSPIANPPPASPAPQTARSAPHTAAPSPAIRPAGPERTSRHLRAQSLPTAGNLKVAHRCPKHAQSQRFAGELRRDPLYVRRSIPRLQNLIPSVPTDRCGTFSYRNCGSRSRHHFFTLVLWHRLPARLPGNDPFPLHIRRLWLVLIHAPSMADQPASMKVRFVERTRTFLLPMQSRARHGSVVLRRGPGFAHAFHLVKAT